MRGRQGEPEQAARLWGAAEALLERARYRGPLLDVGRKRYAEAVAAVRARADETVWQDAWAAGRTMTAEEAIGEACGTRTAVTEATHGRRADRSDRSQTTRL